MTNLDSQRLEDQQIDNHCEERNSKGNNLESLSFSSAYPRVCCSHSTHTQGATYYEQLEVSWEHFGLQVAELVPRQVPGTAQPMSVLERCKQMQALDFGLSFSSTSASSSNLLLSHRKYCSILCGKFIVKSFIMSRFTT